MSTFGFSNGKTYMFQSVLNQQAIDLYCSGYQQSRVWAHPFNRGKSQQWTATAVDNDPESFILSSVCNQSNSYRALDHELANGRVRICYNEFDGRLSQLWYTEQVGPGLVLIRSRANDANITVQGPQDELTLRHHNSETSSARPNLQQHWRLIEVCRSLSATG